MSLEAWGDDGDVDRPYTEERVDELIAEATQELMGVLMDAVEVIKTWHTMNYPKRLYPGDTWKAYYENAPEMRTIRTALASASGTPPDVTPQNEQSPAVAPGEVERDALRPCPFCGGPVKLEQTIDRREWWGVVCRNTINVGGTCAIQQRPSASKEAAIIRWNRRAPTEGKP